MRRNISEEHLNANANVTYRRIRDRNTISTEFSLIASFRIQQKKIFFFPTITNLILALPNSYIERFYVYLSTRKETSSSEITQAT